MHMRILSKHFLSSPELIYPNASSLFNLGAQVITPRSSRRRKKKYRAQKHIIQPSNFYRRRLTRVQLRQSLKQNAFSAEERRYGDSRIGVIAEIDDITSVRKLRKKIRLFSYNLSRFLLDKADIGSILTRS